MNDSTLLIPDSGPDFIKTLKQAVLYSETVHVFTVVDSSIAEAVIAQVSLPRGVREVLGNHPEGVVERMVGRGIEKDLAVNMVNSLQQESHAERFLKFSLDHASLLELGKKEGVIVSLIDMAFNKFRKDKDSLRIVGGQLQSVLEEAKTELEALPTSKTLQSYMDDAPPSLFYLIGNALLMAIEKQIEGAEEEGLELTEEHEEAIEQLIEFGGLAAYLCLASYYALSNNMPVVTWQAQMQQLFDQCSNAIKRGMPPVNELAGHRQEVSRKLGQLILKEAVPNVTDLPLEEILEIRRKRAPELMSFRDAIRRLAVDVDPNLDEDALALELDSKIQKELKPAVENVRVSIRNLELDARNRVLHPSKELGAALIPAAISYSAGAPLAATAAVSAVSAILAKVYEYTIGKKIAEQKILNSCHWSILFDLEKRTKA